MRALTPQTAELLKPAKVRDNDLLKLDVTKDEKHFIARFFTSKIVDDGKIRGVKEGWPSFRVRSFIQRFPEKKELTRATAPGEHWRFGLTDTTAEIIRSAWPSKQLIFADRLAEATFKTVLFNKSRQDLNAENVAHFKNHNKLLPVHDLEIHPGMPLARYQELGVCNSIDNEGYALFMEQGTGKSAIVVARVCNEAKAHWEKTGKPYLCIIVCPNNLRFNWEDEFVKFATQRGRVTRLHGDELDRTRHLINAVDVHPEDRYSVVIVGYDSVGRTQGLKRIQWDLGVLDESHYIKNGMTLRWKAAIELRDRCRQRMVLTGTPITNTCMDLYTQFEFLGKGWSGFTSYTAFKKFYGVFEEQNYDGSKGVLVGVQNMPLLQERLTRQSLIVKKDEVLKDLPKKVWDVHEVEMTKEQTELYVKIRTEVQVKVEDTLNRGLDKTMTVNNILTEMLRLAQVTSGFITYDEIYDDDGNIVQPKVLDRIDPNPKLEALIEILKAKPRTSKSIVWATFIPDIKLIRARLELEGIECVCFYGDVSEKKRVEAVRAFNENPKVKVFIGNPAAGGTGLNLLGYPPGPNEDLYDTNVDHVIYYSQNWSMPQRAQSEDRAHRRGTRVQVRYTDLMIADTIDQVIRERVAGKIEHADSIQDIKAMLDAVFSMAL